MRAVLTLAVVLAASLAVSVSPAVALKPLVGNPAPEFKAVAVYQVCIMHSCSRGVLLSRRKRAAGGPVCP